MVELKWECNDVAGPTKGTKNSACYDLVTPSDYIVFPHSWAYYCLNIKFDIPEGYYIEVYPRSSTLKNYCLVIPTSIIDSDYKDYIHCQMYNGNNEKVTVKKGSRIVQFALHKCEDYMLINDAVNPSDRGGLGSTGV